VDLGRVAEVLAVSEAYDVSAWHEFATALAGASAALTGLVLVAMSIRLREVLAEPIHRLRAESAFVSLLAVLGLALVALFAGISRQAYGAVVVAVALVRLVHIARDARVFVGEPGSEGWLMLAAHVVSSVAELWGGIGLLTRSGGGMYVLAAGLLIHGGIALRVVWFIFVSISEEEAAEIPPEDAPRSAGGGI
jgi:hypothetical protein